VEGGELRAFLMTLDELEHMTLRMERRLRDSRVVEVLTDPNLKVDTKTDFADRANLDELARKLQAVKVDAELREDEDHGAWMVFYHDSTNAEHRISVDLSLTPEYRKLRVLARAAGKFNHPPFTILKNDNRDTQPTWQGLLSQVKQEGKRDVAVQRYKGLGEMNAEQLADTTMNPEKRSLLRVDLTDLAGSDEIFTTLMGEDVESRRKFIEHNALDVKNLDV
jgi:DNA gyrase subunit B